MDKSQFYFLSSLQENGCSLHKIVCFSLGSVSWRLRYVLNPYFNAVLHRYFDYREIEKTLQIFSPFSQMTPNFSIAIFYKQKLSGFVPLRKFAKCMIHVLL